MSDQEAPMPDRQYHIHGPWGTRPSWDEYWLLMAQAVSTRSVCLRRRVGAVLVQNNRIISTGYNGAPAGDLDCPDLPCPRSEHRPVIVNDDYLVFSDPRYRCACGQSWPCPEYVPPGSPYNKGEGRCIAIHAEANVLLYTQGRSSVENSVLYVTCKPCMGCVKLIRGAGIIRIVYPGGSTDD